MKKVFAILLCGIMALGLTGCSPKTAITADDFKAVAESQNLVISDVTEQFAGTGVVPSATIAQSKDGWQVEFYVLTDEHEAIGMFNTNKETFQNYKGNVSSESSVSMKNHASYSLTSSGYYMHICRVDNTLVYVNQPSDNKEAVEALLEELGY